MEKQSNIPVLLGYLYIVLPILIFIIGYCNLPVAIVGTSIICLCSYLLYKNSPKLWIPQNKKDWYLLIIGLIIITFWVYYSGIGCYSFQTPDHNCRNPIFELLVTEKWPVIQNAQYILTYYIGFWLPAAVIGKIFNSINIGYFAQFVWAILGIFLTFYYIAAIFKKKILLPLIIFIFFSGMDIIGTVIVDLLSDNTGHANSLNIFSHLEWYFPGFQFSSFTTQLYWVFNQAIPAWVAMLLLLHEKDNRSMIFIYSCLFLCSTLPAIGMLPILFYLCLKNGNNSLKHLCNKNNFINILKNGFSVQNVLGTLFITPITYLYLSNNIASTNISGVAKNTSHITLGFILIWLIMFIMLEVGFYLCYTFKKYKSDPLYYIIWLCFLFYPFIHIGGSNDFCMRATIPALIILYLYVVSIFYEENKSTKSKLFTIALIVTLILGSFTPFHEITRSVYWTAKGITKTESKLGFENFFGSIDNNLFIKFIGKR